MDGDEVQLTAWQKRLLAMLARDCTAVEMAAETRYSKVWVYHELRVLRETLGVRTNWGAVALGVKMGVVRVRSGDE